MEKNKKFYKIIHVIYFFFFLVCLNLIFSPISTIEERGKGIFWLIILIISVIYYFIYYKKKNSNI